VNASAADAAAWRRLFGVLKEARHQPGRHVPDAGHARLIELCRADPAIKDVVLTTEEEGVALAPAPGSAASVPSC